MYTGMFSLLISKVDHSLKNGKKELLFNIDHSLSIVKKMT